MSDKQWPEDSPTSIPSSGLSGVAMGRVIESNLKGGEGDRVNRIGILQTATQLIGSERPSIYGEASVNLECMNKLMDVYNDYSMNRSLAHEAAMMMVMAKISRIACGKYHSDNYVDAAGYIAIAGELGGNSSAT